MSNKDSSEEHNDPSICKGTRAKRVILGDIQPIVNRVLSSVNHATVPPIGGKCSTHAPRRSLRISMARGVAATTTTGLRQVVIKPVVPDEVYSQRNQEIKPERKKTTNTTTGSRQVVVKPVVPDDVYSQRNEDIKPERKKTTNTTTGSRQVVDKPVVLDDVYSQRNEDIKSERKKNATEGQAPPCLKNSGDIQDFLAPHLHGTRKASRRLSDEFDKVPTKRARRTTHIIRKNKNGDVRPQEHHNMSITNFEPTKFTFGFSPHDVSSRGDVLKSPEYVSDIFQRLYHSEALNAPICYMHNQYSITATMRAILVDWLVDVHLKFRCVPETLHLAVNIIDRYLSTVAITRDVLQLVGITALLLASKYEEIFPPEVKNCVMICRRAYNVQQILDMEADMLGELSFNLTVPTGHPFLQRFLFITHATETMSIAANYYIERMLQEHDSLKYRPSIIAAAAVCLAINHPEIRDFDEIDAPKPGVPQVLVDYTGFTPEMITTAADFVASKVCELVKTKADRSLTAVQRKYSYSRYRHVSTYFESPDAVDILDDSS